MKKKFFNFLLACLMSIPSTCYTGLVMVVAFPDFAALQRGAIVGLFFMVYSKSWLDSINNQDKLNDLFKEIEELKKH